MDLRTLIRRLYGLGCYAVAGIATPYLLLFAGDAVVPLAINRGAPLDLDLGPLAVVVDLALIAVFGLQHSVMARPAWKQWLARRLPASVERSTYVLAASLVLAGLMVGWQPIGGTVWRLDGLPAHAMTAGYVAGFALVYVAALWLDHFHLLGLRQAWFAAPTSAPERLRISGPYRFVRHPLMTGLLAVFWFTPHMSWDQLVLAAAMTGYVVIGTLYEERALRRQFGDAYAAYARLTPMLTPMIVPVLTRYRARRAPPAALAVRRPEIDFAPYGPIVWYADNVVATALLTAYSVLFPPLERHMADELRATLPDLRDPELARAVRDFVGQESLHAHEHARSLACLAGLGYRVDGLARWFAWVSRWILRPLTGHVAHPVCGASGSIAVFAGVEHWTATMAEAVLQMRYPRMYGPIVSLYYWHAAEELEHKSVVADVLAHLGSSYPVRILMFVSGTIAFVGLSLVGTLAILVQIPALQGRGALGYLTFPLRVAWDAVVFGLVREKVAWHFVRGVFRYLMPFHHPDQRSTQALVARGLELSVATGGALRPARKADA